MRRLASILVALAMCGMAWGMAQSAAHAADVCKFDEWGYGYVRIAQQGKVWTYLITSSGPHWRTQPLGYHGPGSLVCGNCSSPPGEVGGPYHFIAQAERRELPRVEERAHRRREWLGYPPLALRPEDLEHLGSREGIAVGSLAGYAILHRLVASSKKDAAWGQFLRARERGLLVIALSDGCVSFEASMLVELRGGNDPWATLDSLLSEVRIQKAHGAPPGPVPHGTYSAVVKAPRKAD
jgi:hypothetical protein